MVFQFSRDQGTYTCGVMLAALIPFYDRCKIDYGVSMEVLREELTRAPFFQDNLWLNPHAGAAEPVWASENALASRPMVGVGSRVVMAAKPKRPRKWARDDGSGGGGGGSGGGGGGGGGGSGADEGWKDLVLSKEDQLFSLVPQAGRKNASTISTDRWKRVHMYSSLVLTIW
jgi:hypothetical protein